MTYVHKDVTEGRTDGSVTISLRNFVGEGITKRGNQLFGPLETNMATRVFTSH